MNKAFLWVLVAAVAIGSGVILYYGLQGMGPEFTLPTARPAATPSPPPAGTKSEPRFPIEAQEKPLPSLGESDPALRGAVFGLLDDKSLESLLVPQDFVKRVVATIDNLPRRKLAPRLMPVKPAGGALATTGGDTDGVIAPRNSARYARYVRLAEAMDTRRLVAVYVHFYPLFQQAFRELGYPNGYFNDGLIEAIDSLLAAPDVREPVRVVRPKVFYQLADPELEVLPAGQKVLLRIGPENASRVKAKLREIRAELTKEARKQ
jgi:hypothetical protein